MATVYFYQAQDMAKTYVWYGNITSYSATHISLADNGLTATYYGSFYFNNTGLSGGSVTGYEQFVGGAPDYRVTGVNARALTVEGYLNSGNSQGLQQYVLSGADTIYGSPSADALQGWSGNDNMQGNAGNDLLKGGSGNDVLDGGAGVDTAVFSGTRSSYSLSWSPSAWAVSSTADGTDTLSNIERLQFSDKVVALDVNGNAGQAYRLYQATFNRTPDITGLTYQTHTLDDGWSLSAIAKNFIESPEFSKTYGSLDNSNFVAQLYQNVLHRAPDASGLKYHVEHLNDGMARENVLVGFSESPENQIAVIGVIQNGIDLLN